MEEVDEGGGEAVGWESLEGVEEEEEAVRD